MFMQIPRVTSLDKHRVVGIDLMSHEFLNKRKINLSGEVTDVLAANIIAQIEYLDELNTKDIYLYINSPGGAVSAGLSIMDSMNRAKSKIITVCTGAAASMGAFLVACGEKGNRYITQNAEMMIHQPLGGVQGQASDMAIAAKRIVETRNKLNKILAEKTGQEIEVIEKDTDRDFWLSANEAVEYGLVDKILDDSTGL